MMISKEIKYFDWIDIQKEICKQMNLDEKYFRDYHKVIGGEYKDLWHEWMNYFDEVTKDSIVMVDLGECIESKLEWVKEDGKDWLEPFVNAVYKVWDDNEIEYVRYFW
jgi:hypothetical protein